MIRITITMVKMFLYFFTILSLQLVPTLTEKNIPIVVTTWEFRSATENAWQVLNRKGSALDAVETGAKTCEELQCDGTVGFGGSPDEDGETTLDALIMDGRDLNVGAVAALRRIKSAVSVARHVLEHTSHSILAGELASKFAVKMGFKEEKLNTPTSKKIWSDWKNNKCQPNFWTKVKPDPYISCGPYVPDTTSRYMYVKRVINKYNHDTIGTIAIDQFGNIAAGTSSNGANHKIPGRVGDSPIPGAGAYADNKVGAAAATGDGDVMLRFLPSFLIVEEMRRGATPTEAAKTSIERIIQYYPHFMGGVIAVNKRGEYGAACHGLDEFPFVVRHPKLNETFVHKVHCET